MKAFLCLVAAGMFLSLLLIQGYSPTSPLLQDGQPAIVYVDDDNMSGYEDGSLLHPFNTIPEGVSAVSKGGIVIVLDGIYSEEVEILKSLTLQGASNDRTILSSQSQDSIFIWADDVSVKNFWIRDGPSDGIHVQLSANVSIENVVVSNLSRGLYLDSSSSMDVSDMMFSDVEFGILAAYFENSTISNASIHGALKYGIALTHTRNVEVVGNTISNSDVGILIGGYLLSSSNVSIVGNTLFDNPTKGISLVSVFKSEVVGNSVVHSSVCLMCLDSLELGISENRMEECYDSIHFTNLSQAVVHHNNILHNSVPPPAVYDDNPLLNHWHHPDLLEGNYWSDYAGVDDGSGIGKHAIGGDGIGDTNIPHPNVGFDNYPFIVESGWETPPINEVTVHSNIDPDTLNLKSKGRWITAYLSTENASIFDIDVSTILLQDTLAPERWDYQDDVLMLKFNRQEFKGTVQVGESIEVKVTGRWEDGTAFEVYDHIRVIDSG